jgi:FkbM family methyltransferase
MNIFKEDVEFNFVELSDNIECRDWLKENFINWDPFVFKCFRQVANPSKIAIDIGAWIGLTGIWLSKNFKNIICIEADKLSIKALEANLNASNCNNYIIIPNALYNKKTKLYFGPNSFKKNSTLNESMSQLKIESDKYEDYLIETIIFSDIIKDLPVYDIGLLKIDIEGGEEYIIEEIMSFSNQYKIPILLSFHIGWWKNKNINRVTNLFKTCIITSDIKNEIIINENIFEHLSLYPFCTLFCTYL